MPLLVLWRLGPAEAAYFALPWLILMGLTILLWNVSSSLVVEITGGHGESRGAVRRSLLLYAAVAVGALLVCVLGARPLLELAGPKYASEGAGLLRLIGLSIPFTAMMAPYKTLVWLDQRVWALALYQAVLGVAVLGIALALFPQLGLAAAGAAVLITQAAGAAVMGPLAIRRIHRQRLAAAT
jgi:O-antigen/teichoic acid export membrane protein